MRSQKPTEHFGTAVGSKESDKEDFQCYHHPSYMFNRDTYQMSPLLFESDTEDTSQSTEFKCYQEKTTTPQPPTQNSNQHMHDIISMLSNSQNEISSQLDASSQHNQCCSETLLNSSHHRTIIDATRERNTNSAYISPSPRVTRSKWLKSRILTRSAKRLHKISELDEYSESPISSRKARTKKDSRTEKRNSADRKHSKTKASDRKDDEVKLFEAIRKTKVRVVLERLKFPFFQNPHQVHGKFIQPNIVPEIAVDNDCDDGLDFLNRRLSSEVQILTERPAVISISSGSTIRNASTPTRMSPDLFENFESSSVSNLCSQNSFNIPNGQVLMRSPELRVSDSETSLSPNNQQHFDIKPSISDLFDQNCFTPDVNVERQKLLAFEDKQLVQQNTFEITVNEVFDNVIHITDSEETLTSQNPINECDLQPQQLPQLPTAAPSDNLVNLIHSNHYASSQEVTPKKRPEISGLLNKSVGACPSTSLNRSKWLSKPRCDDSDDDLSNRSSQRCRRLDLWFGNENKPRNKGNVDVRKSKFSNLLLLSSSEEEDS